MQCLRETLIRHPGIYKFLNTQTIRYVLIVFLILIQNSILNHIHNINTGTGAACNVRGVVSILIFKFFNLCLMVDFVIWGVSAMCQKFYHRFTICCNYCLLDEGVNRRHSPVNRFYTGRQVGAFSWCYPIGSVCGLICMCVLIRPCPSSIEQHDHWMCLWYDSLTLKMVTALYAKMLEQLQQMMWSNTEGLNQSVMSTYYLYI